jgi:hypothetical protein
MMPQPLPRPAFPWECCLFAMPTEVTIPSSIWRSRTCSRPHGCSRGGWQHTAPNDNQAHARDGVISLTVVIVRACARSSNHKNWV